MTDVVERNRGLLGPAVALKLSVQDRDESIASTSRRELRILSSMILFLVQCVDKYREESERPEISGALIFR